MRLNGLLDLGGMRPVGKRPSVILGRRGGKANPKAKEKVIEKAKPLLNLAKNASDSEMSETESSKPEKQKTTPKTKAKASGKEKAKAKPKTRNRRGRDLANGRSLPFCL